MMKRLLITALMSCSLLCNGQDFDNCFAIIVGKNASADGSVILGHNEDDADEQMLNCYFTSPRRVEAEKQYGTRAAGYFWAELPGMAVADAFMNDYGVAVVSDNCKSREDAPELTDGGVLYEIRVNVARYARSAREGVDIIGSLVSKYGYTDPGRTYIVADTSEAWLVAVVQGKHWVASRVPDDGVVVIPNYYVTDRIDLSDTANFVGSPDIISYAEKRGWYDPAKDGEFSFRKAYAHLVSRGKPFNVERHKDAFAFFGFKTDDPFNMPYSFTPEKKVSVSDIMAALSLHRDKFAVGSLSRNSTVLSTIFQMRPQLPKVLGCICWMAVGHPGVEPYFPVYLGMTEMPGTLSRFGSNFRKAEERHFTDCKGMRERYPKHNWWKHLDRWNGIYNNPEELEFGAASKAAVMQEEIFDAQEAFEAGMLKYCSEVKPDGEKYIMLARRLNDNFAKYYSKWVFNF